ncbi:MAG: glycosyl hydrolase, partial [Prevotella sp.]|nr:glycosyl hydrolase [Prevotella sp.]
HARYACYWYQQTEENFKNSSMAADENAAAALLERTMDFVVPGEQQSEAGHEYKYSSGSTTGNYNGEAYRDARANGFVQYSLFNKSGKKDSLSIMLRFTTADKGRKGTLMVDGTKIADITVPETVADADNGFYNVEFPIPAALAVNADGTAKAKFVVKLAASATTLMPGLYYMRLMSGYEEDPNYYRFVASQWTTGDGGRVSASNITYDKAKNIIHVNAGTCANNVALMLNYQNLAYTIGAAEKYLVVRGTNLKTTNGASYLWWLNGTNKGSQVAPAVVREISVDGQTQIVVAWDMTTSGLYENFTGSRPSVCKGQTIFGLTSTTGKSDIYDISFVADMEQYVQTATTVSAVTRAVADGVYYTLGGVRTDHPTKGVYLTNGRVVVKR